MNVVSLDFGMFYTFYPPLAAASRQVRHEKSCCAL
jgi:hypothetical protein